MVVENNLPSYLLLPLEQGFSFPNNEQLASFKSKVNWTTKDLADFAGIKDKHLRGKFQEKRFLKGDVIEYYVWRLWLESFGFVSPLSYEPRVSEIRSCIFLDDENFDFPTIFEFSEIAKRTGHSADTISKKLKINVKLVSSFISNPQQNTFRVAKELWFEFLSDYGFYSLSDFNQPPTLHEKSLNLIDSFEAPRPHQLRQFVAWTGYSPEELAAMFGLSSSKLRYYMVNRSARSADATITTKIFSRDSWIPPYSRELRAIINVKRVDPGLVSRMLRLKKEDVFTYLKSPESIRLINVKQDDWFLFLDKIGVYSAEDVNKVLAKESKVHPIPFACWRLMLSAFGLVEVVKLEIGKRI
ncbi:hypothetical protein [Vibrio fluvialis]|uniref:hypothetical protein n=1 Tax=Vibrio fluvialis TaxID=676 RepID=UPI00192BB411|nr:hypothetical protein [Vibrio fluvialis]MBL4262793.1 hypothetical protein [Vibrio fluvialis]